jgi:DNA-binding winged helix-turn-helix (wHTH) protein
VAEFKERFYQFGEFRLDPVRRVVSREGKDLQLETKVFDALAILVRNSPRLVTKQELTNLLWPNVAAASESNLAATISSIRKVLGDSSKKYIETVHGRGYVFRGPVKQSSEKPLVAYVSHSAAHSIGSIKRLLYAEGFDVRDSFDLSAPDDFVTTIQSNIRAADAVIAVVDSEARSVFFELGLAKALRKPILLLVTPGESLPVFAAREPHLVSDLSDSEFLRLGLQKFLRTSVLKSVRSSDAVPPSIDSVDPENINAILKEVKRLRSSPTEIEIQQLIVKLLSGMASNVVKQYHGPTERGVDLAVWNDALQSSLGNPLLVEIKAGALNLEQLTKARNQLAEKVLRSDSRLGLLLYFDRSGRRFPKEITSSPLVLAFDVEDFAKELLRTPFTRLLIEQRNRIVHSITD